MESINLKVFKESLVKDEKHQKLLESNFGDIKKAEQKLLSYNSDLIKSLETIRESDVNTTNMIKMYDNFIQAQK
jgi:hypothetical protein